MTPYLSTFVAGAGQIIAKQLKSLPLERLRILQLAENQVIYESDYPKDRIIDFRFFNNTYILLEQFTDQAIPAALQSLEANKPWNLHTLKPYLFGPTFQLIINDAGQPVSGGTQSVMAITASIAKSLRLQPSTHRPHNEFWLLHRSDGQSYFGLRLYKPGFKTENQAAGSLRPELAHILCLAAAVNSKDTILDPFAGSGAILQECLSGFGAKQLYGLDNDPTHTRPRQRFTIQLGDATKLPYQDNAMTKVITDPPWGKFNKTSTTDLLLLYLAAWQEICRVLKKGGVAVILAAAPEAIAQVTDKVSELELVKSYPVLVSGQKATIYKFRKQDVLS